MATEDDANLTSGGWSDTNHPDTLDRVIETTAQLAAVTAERLRCVAQLHREAVRASEEGGAVSRELVERSLRLELSAALRITERAADALLSRADALVNRHPNALQALACGTITERHADLFTDAMDELQPEQRADIEDLALKRAEELATGAYRRWLQRLVDTINAPTLAERHHEALARRGVTVTSDRDGMGTLAVHGPAVEVHAVFDRITRMSKVIGDQHGETRSRDQLRADILFDLLIEGVVTAHPKRARGIRAEVVVTVPALSLLRDSVADAAPATVEGIGPIPIHRARELCGDAKDWMRVLTHPETGVVLSVGRKKYRPPAQLAQLVQWRAERCLAPGCGMPAHRCEIDHSVAWAEGGVTAAWNLDPLCKGHHVMRHHGGWEIRQLEGGVLEWTSPLGRVYLAEPERRTPSFRPDTGGGSGGSAWAAASWAMAGESAPF